MLLCQREYKNCYNGKGPVWRPGGRRELREIRVLSRGQVRGLGKRRWGQGEGGHQGDDESKSYSLRVEEEGRREVAKVSGERVCGDLAPRKNRVFPHSRQSLGNTVPPPVRVAETVLSLLRGVHSTL